MITQNHKKNIGIVNKNNYNGTPVDNRRKVQAK